MESSGIFIYRHLIQFSKSIVCTCIKNSVVFLRKYTVTTRGGGHKARGQGQGHKKIRGQGQPFRRQTLSRPRTGILEAKAKDQGHQRECSPKKKRSSQKFFRRSPQKNVFQKIFLALHTILTIQKIVLSSSRGQHYF